MLQNNKKYCKKWLMLTFSTVFTIFVLAGCGNNSVKKTTHNSEIVATYEGGEVTQNEFDTVSSIMSFLNPNYEKVNRIDQAREALLKQYIGVLWVNSKASDDVKKSCHKKAEEALNKGKKQIGSNQFKEKLDKYNLTKEQISNYLARACTLGEYYKSKVTDDQLKVEFEKIKKDMTTATVRHILIGFKDKGGKERKKEDALKMAKVVQTRLKKGEDFAKLAEQMSEDPGSAKQGGLYKDATVGGWAPSFKEAALTLPLQQISEPVETTFGYHVIRVEKRQEKEYSKLTANEKDAFRGYKASELVNKFMEKELPNLIKDIKLPKIKTKPKKPEEKKNDKNQKTKESKDKKSESGK